VKRGLQPATADPQQAHRDDHGAEVLTQIQICRRLGISDETWRRWRKAGLTPPQLELPGHPRWRWADVESCMARRERPTRRAHFGRGVRLMRFVRHAAESAQRDTGRER
jgi:hypothetical protein